MPTKAAEFYLDRDKRGKFIVRIERNGNIIWSTTRQGYSNRKDAIRAMEILCEMFGYTRLVDIGYKDLSKSPVTKAKKK